MKFYLIILFVLVNLSNTQSTDLLKTSISSLFKLKNSFNLTADSKTDGSLKIAINKTPVGYQMTTDLSSASLLSRINVSKKAETTGWNYLSVSSFAIGDLAEQSFAAGYLEGYVTATEISQFYRNLIKNNFEKEKPTYLKIRTFFSEVVSELEQNLRKYPDSRYSEKVTRDILIGYSQINGLMKGYNDKVSKNESDKIDLVDFLLMQADGEISELISFLLNRNFQTESQRKLQFTIHSLLQTSLWY